MNIEILGAGFNNKGAHLMLIAVVEELSRSCPDARLAVRSKKGRDWEPGELGLHQKPAISESAIGSLAIRSRFSRKARQRYHMILDAEIDAVLDVSGFKYSDQFGHLGIWRRAKRIAIWKKSGKKIILLPQAFGPFENPRIQEAVRIITDSADLIFPRDKDSYNYLTDLVGEREHINMYPDFTNIVTGRLPDSFPSDKTRTCLIPNANMVEKTPGTVGESYIPFLARCVRYLQENNLDPFILLHDRKKDRPLIQEIQKLSDSPLKIVEEDDPVNIKGIIGSSYLVIGSRFHGLISAMSQGVPAMATGWSHKYERLFEDYGCPELMVSNLDFDAEASGKLKMLTNTENYGRIVKILNRSAQIEIQKTKQMWQDVMKVLLEGS